MYWTDERIQTYRAKIKGAWYVQEFKKHYQYDLRKPEDKVRMYRELDPKEVKSCFDSLMDDYEADYLKKLNAMTNDDLLETLDNLREDGYIDMM
ncbi:hypothetical protein [Apilactobacillus bombintestini]|uniref:Uncharacterized protein n=1 Tax=Apilactobacillus bombintestini TaxID=2419772 RepID=A0A387ASF2_9LACO|nr:hypothetical protein [Apilactobacillus bombintestini]AYF92145.1 hypothetical protein D7I45_00895 [Apilactobacillus bombintestini]